MQGSNEVFEQTIRSLEGRFPQVAAEVRDEVNRGRLVKGADLPESERAVRQDRLTAKKLGRITKDEMAVVAYTDDERLALLCEAILTLAQTMTTTRRTLLKMMDLHGIDGNQIVFAEPDEVESEMLYVNLSDELGTTEQALTQITEILRPALQEVGTWH
jgi:hypothetical protein